MPLSFVTDYDCWHEESEAVTVEMVIAYLNKNVENASKLLEALVESLDSEKKECTCSHALKNSIMTDTKLIPQATYDKLEPIIGKYVKKKEK